MPLTYVTCAVDRGYRITSRAFNRWRKREKTQHHTNDTISSFEKTRRWAAYAPSRGIVSYGNMVAAFETIFLAQGDTPCRRWFRSPPFLHLIQYVANWDKVAFLFVPHSRTCLCRMCRIECHAKPCRQLSPKRVLHRGHERITTCLSHS